MNALLGLKTAALRWAGPFLLLLAIWWPEWTHYRIDRATDPALENTFSPASTVDRHRLSEIGAIDLAETSTLAITPIDITRAVETGSLYIPRLSQGRWPLRGYPNDMQQGPPSFRLFMASLSLERLLLAAWRSTGQERWLNAALERITQFAEHEATQRHDRGFLWNDHAVASRASTLILAWLALQEHPELKPANARALMAFVLRTGRMLAKPEQFTVRTNHGVMQNLALFQLAAAFPQLPEARAWRDVADARLRLQLTFYVSPEGVVLEHSPGYHHTGTQLLAWAKALRNWNGLSVDAQVDSANSGAAAVLAELLRPDGTLPAIGNTDGHTVYRRDSVVSAVDPSQAEKLYPIAGWGLWWPSRDTADAAQLMFTWAHHVGHGHKHADEGAFTWWGAGQTLVTGVGYWPYGDPLVRKAYEWDGSNAPHGRSELGSSKRESKLLGHGSNDGLLVADLERIRDDKAHFRRTLLGLGPTTVLVLDFHKGVPEGARTIWTFGPNVGFTDANDAHTWTSGPLHGGWRVSVGFDSSAPVAITHASASDGTAAGWTTVQREPREVISLRVDTEAPEGAMASLFDLHRGAANRSKIALSVGASPTHWRIDLQLDGHEWTVTRDDDWIRMAPSQGRADTARQVRLATVDDGQARAILRSAYSAATRQFPPWRDLWEYRVKASILVAGLAAALGMGWWCAAWWQRESPTQFRTRENRRSTVALAGLWLAIAIFVLEYYLRP